MDTVAAALVLSCVGILCCFASIFVMGRFYQLKLSLSPSEISSFLRVTVYLSLLSIAAFQVARFHWWVPAITLPSASVIVGWSMTHGRVMFFAICHEILNFVCLVIAIGCWFIPRFVLW